MENINWSSLGFDYYKTEINARSTFDGEKWSELVYTDDEYIQMHISTTCLHYGLQAFEGMKAFRGVDGKVRLFRPEENARRAELLDLIDAFQHFEPIDPDLVAKDSLLREFIGGGSYQYH